MLASASDRFARTTSVLLLLLALASGFAPSGQAGDDDDDDDEQGKSEPMPEIARGYSRAPYLQALGSDSVLIAWIASDPGAPAVDFGTTQEYGRTAAARSDGSRRSAVLRGLDAGTRYFYRVRAGQRSLAAGTAYSFRTDEGPNDRQFTFFATGDLGDTKGRQVATAQSILRARVRPELGIVCGDVVYNRGRSVDYDRYLMRPWQDVLSTIPVWPALGNHDWKSPPAKNWEREWYLPNNEHYYSFDYANAHFIALDSQAGEMYDREQQVAWLERDLAAHANADWIFVYFHHPVITCTYKGNTQALIDYCLPLFDRYKVDVVFAGHAHTYERLYPLRHGKPVDVEQDPHYKDPDGTLFIVTGAGGKWKKGRPTTRCGPTAFFRDQTLLWTQVQVQGSRCTIRSYASENDELVDEVTITKTRLAASMPGSR